MRRITDVLERLGAWISLSFQLPTRTVHVISVTLVGIFFGTTVLSGQQAYQVALESDRLVRFTSSTAIDEFEGTTERLDGLVLLNTEELTDRTGGAESEIYFEVDLASLDTGIGMRDRQMRNSYLEVDRYPYAAFGGTIEQVVSLPGKMFQVTTQGILGIHGVEQERALTCNLAKVNEGYRVNCSFSVFLSDHDIEIPKLMFLKLNNEIRMELNFILEPVELDSEN